MTEEGKSNACASCSQNLIESLKQRLENVEVKKYFFIELLESDLICMTLSLYHSVFPGRRCRISERRLIKNIFLF